MPAAPQPHDPHDFLTAAYDYVLPPEAIAQAPIEPRDQARLWVELSTAQHHSFFYALPQYLGAGDLLVVNDTRVIPARLYGTKSTGAQAEVLLLEQHQLDTWLALVKPGKRLPEGSVINFGEGFSAEVIDRDAPTGGRILRFHWPRDRDFWQCLHQYGQMPLPPYITDPQDPVASQHHYQTIWADRPGAVAAPTAGLHFTPQLLVNLKDAGINVAQITLHVGLGTFRPVEAVQITDHAMHSEWLEVGAAAVESIRATQAAGGRVIAVGTTVVRSLETAAQAGTLAPYSGKSELFIYPGYQWRVIDGLITNFHLPQSTLLMLVSALIGRDRTLALYHEALDRGYRFFSYGDGMLLLP